MLLLSFYFYFIKNAYLGFISSFYPLHQFQALFIGNTDFQQLDSMKEVFRKHVFFTSLIHASREGKGHDYWAYPVRY